jgi:hypothetical protein
LTFITDELAEHCYPNAPAIERKHQVSVLRAAQKVVANDPDWTAWRGEGQGRTWVFPNRANVQSYALARMMVEGYSYYRSERRARRAAGYSDFPLLNGRQVPAGCEKVVKGGFPYIRRWGDTAHLMTDRDELLARLRGSRNQHYVELWAPDGAWTRHVAQHCAERDGDTEAAEALKARSNAELAEWASMFSKRFAASAVADNETLNAQPRQLAELAGRVRALMTQDDPDAVRAELAQIAAVLDGLAGETQGE